MLLLPSVSSCASCTIPLPLHYCPRNKLSSTVTGTQQLLTFYDALSKIFKLSTSTSSSFGPSFQDLELCRYCCLNIEKLLQRYETVVQVAKETGSVFSKLIFQPTVIQSAEIECLDEHYDEVDQGVDIHSDVSANHAPLDLDYLGLIPKKRKRLTDIESDVVAGDERSTACHNGELGGEILLHELILTDAHHEEGQAQVKEEKKSPNSKGLTPTEAKRVGRPPKKLASPESPSECSKETNKGSPKKSKKDDCVCKICKKKFKHTQFLQQHMRVHSNDKRCAQCQKKFKSAALLKRHMRIHDDENPSFKCDDCGREFPNLLGLQVHAVTHTRTLFICKGCKRKFKIEKNFIQHQETARCTEKKHACPTCGKLFKNKDKVKRHLISIHSETKPFSCNTCGKGFRSQADLRFHEVNAHICGDAKQFQCGECGKRFKSSDTLKSHEMYSHKMEKKYFCQTCGKGFPLLATLKIHEVSHSEDRPYMCTYCGRTYKHANDLKSHEVVHYKDEEKPYVCPVCGSRYHRKDVLRLHQAREKHFGPDVPLPPNPRRQTEPTKSKRTSVNPPKFDETTTNIPEENLALHSGDSNISVSTASTPSILVTQVAPNNISVIQALSAHQPTTFVTQPVATVQGTSSITNTTHIVPILQTSALALPQQPQQANTVGAPPTFNVTVTPVNEAITDFYRIMYDLA